MTVARFEVVGATVDIQALECFRRLRDILDGLDQPLGGTSALLVEVTYRRSLVCVAEARRRVFGEQKPPWISRRVTRLPPGEHVRVTVAIGGEEPT